MNSCERELKEAEKLIRKLEKEVERLEKLLNAIIAYCNATAQTNARVMGAGGMGRAEYGFLKGQNEVCNALLSLLGQPTIAVKKRAKGILGLGQGLFEDVFG